MSGFLSGFFARRAAKPSGNAPQANPAAQFDILLSQYNSSYQALETQHQQLTEAIEKAEEDYKTVYASYVTGKDQLTTAQGKLLGISAENDNHRHELATKEVAIKDLAGRVEELRHNIAVVEATQTEQRARFRRECDKIVDEASALVSRMLSH